MHYYRQTFPVPQPDAARPPSFAALRQRDFRLLWSAQFVSWTGSQMQLVAINWPVYLLAVAFAIKKARELLDYRLGDTAGRSARS